MDVGIGLPNTVKGVDRAGTVEWARRAEEAGFSSLGMLGRIAFPNYEELVSLAAAAAVTERIRLVTDVLLAPLRCNTALVAKQAATLDSLSEGRLVLGLAVGTREDDYEVSGVEFHERGRIFEGTEEHAREDLGHYYAWLGEELANMIIESAATDADTVKSYLAAFEEAGADEVICCPVSTDPGQVELLADAAL